MLQRRPQQKNWGAKGERALGSDDKGKERGQDRQGEFRKWGNEGKRANEAQRTGGMTV